MNRQRKGKDFRYFFPVAEARIWINHPREMEQEKAIGLVGDAVGKLDKKAYERLSTKLDDPYATIRIKVGGNRRQRKVMFTFAGSSVLADWKE